MRDRYLSLLEDSPFLLQDLDKDPNKTIPVARSFLSDAPIHLTKNEQVNDLIQRLKKCASKGAEPLNITLIKSKPMKDSRTTSSLTSQTSLPKTTISSVNKNKNVARRNKWNIYKEKAKKYMYEDKSKQHQAQYKLRTLRSHMDVDPNWILVSSTPTETTKQTPLRLNEFFSDYSVSVLKPNESLNNFKPIFSHLNIRSHPLRNYFTCSTDISKLRQMDEFKQLHNLTDIKEKTNTLQCTARDFAFLVCADFSVVPFYLLLKKTQNSFTLSYLSIFQLLQKNSENNSFDIPRDYLSYEQLKSKIIFDQTGDDLQQANLEEVNSLLAKSFETSFVSTNYKSHTCRKSEVNITTLSCKEDDFKLESVNIIDGKSKNSPIKVVVLLENKKGDFDNLQKQQFNSIFSNEMENNKFLFARAITELVLMGGRELCVAFAKRRAPNNNTNHNIIFEKVMSTAEIKGYAEKLDVFGKIKKTFSFVKNFNVEMKDGSEYVIMGHKGTKGISIYDSAKTSITEIETY